ncbi:hypothetical protein [Streptomyces sp. NPDC000888]
MRVKVAVVSTRDGFLLRLTEVQKQLICETLVFQADRSDGDRPSVVRIGIDRASAMQIRQKIREPNSEFHLNEIHVLFAALVATPVLMPSEEEFYGRIGFFREQAFALAGGLVGAIGELSETGKGSSGHG